MADPLLIAASIAGLLALGGKVVSVGYDLAVKTREARKQIDSVMKETLQLLVTLQEMNAILGDLPEDELYKVKGSLELLESTIEETEELLEKVKKIMKNNRRILLVMKISGLEDTADKLQNLRAAFVGWITMRMTRKIDQKVTEILSVQQDMTKLSTVRWLMEDPTDPIPSFAKYDKEELASIPAGGDWIFETVEYTSWKSGKCDSKTLWINGIAGSGKTILMSKIHSHLDSEVRGNPQYALASFFADSSKHNSQKRQARLLRSILGQLLTKLPGEFWPEGFTKSSTYPKIPELIDKIIEISGRFEQVFIMIDGLDEFPHAEILTAAQRFMKDSTSIKLCVGSRREPGIGSAFDCMTSSLYNLTITAANIADDITAYINSRIEGSLGLKRARAEIPDMVGKLRNGADGMFLWAVKQMDYLCSLLQVSKVQQALNHMPSGLHELFETMLSRTSDIHFDLAKAIFQWLVCAQRPLHLSELGEAIAMDGNTGSLADIDPLIDPHAIVKICSGFVECSVTTSIVRLSHLSIREFLTSDKHIAGSQHQKYHVSVSESQIEITRTCLKYLSFRDLEWNHRIDHTQLVVKGALLEYAAVHVWEHLRQAQRGDMELAEDLQRLIGAITPMTTNIRTIGPQVSIDSDDDDLYSVQSSSMIQITPPKDRLFQEDPSTTQWPTAAPLPLSLVQFLAKINPSRYQPGMQLIHLAAIEGISAFIHGLHAKGFDMNSPEPESRRTPIHYAVENFHVQAVKTLLQLGANADGVPSTPGGRTSIGACNRSPLQTAMESGDENMVSTLLCTNKEDNVPNLDRPFDSASGVETALSMAVSNCWLPIVCMLFENGASPTMVFEDGASIQHIAAEAGDVGVLRKVLEYTKKSVETDAFLRGELLYLNIENLVVDCNGLTPLHTATHFYHRDPGRARLDCISELLKYGYQANDADGTGWTPLHEAIQYGDEVLIKRLVKCPRYQRGYERCLIQLSRMPQGSNTRQLPILPQLSDSSSTKKRWPAPLRGDQSLDSLDPLVSGDMPPRPRRPSPIAFALETGILRLIPILFRLSNKYDAGTCRTAVMRHILDDGLDASLAQELLSCAAAAITPTDLDELLQSESAKCDPSIIETMLGRFLATMDSTECDHFLGDLIRRDYDASTKKPSMQPQVRANPLAVAMLKQIRGSKRLQGCSEALTVACHIGNIELVSLLLESGSCTLSHHGTTDTPLEVAIQRPSLEIFCRLIVMGSPLTQSSVKKLWLKLPHISSENRSEAFRILIEHFMSARFNETNANWKAELLLHELVILGIHDLYPEEQSEFFNLFVGFQNPDWFALQYHWHQNPSKEIPLQVAIRSNNRPAITALLSMYDTDSHPPSDSNMVIRRSLESLNFSSREAYWIFQELVKRGADPNYPRHGIPYLASAVQHHNLPVIKALFDGGASMDGIIMTEDDETRSYEELDAYGGLESDLVDWNRESCKERYRSYLDLIRYGTPFAEDVVRYLISKGADPNRSTGPNFPFPLHQAVNAMDRHAVTALLELGADPNMAESQNNSETYYPLHKAIETGDTVIIKALLSARADTTTQTQPAGLLPVQLAVLKRKSSVAKLLIDAGADPNARGAFGTLLPLHIAIKQGDINSVAMLLDHGAQVNAKSHNGCSSIIMIDPKVPLEKNQSEILRILLRHRPDVDQQDPSGKTILHLAITNALEEVGSTKERHAIDFLDRNLKLLLDAGCNPTICDNDGYTALDYMARSFIPESSVLEKLASLGASMDSVNPDNGMTMLHLAASRDLDRVRKLLELGANPNIQDRKGKTALHEAVEYPHQSVNLIVKALIAANADVNISDKTNQASLLAAVKSSYLRQRTADHLSVVSQLLKAGSDPNATDGDHRTPLHFYATPEYNTLANSGIPMYLGHRANPNIQDLLDDTPLHLAVYRDHEMTPSLKILLDATTTESLELKGSKGTSVVDSVKQTWNSTLEVAAFLKEVSTKNEKEVREMQETVVLEPEEEEEVEDRDGVRVEAPGDSSYLAVRVFRALRASMTL